MPVTVRVRNFQSIRDATVVLDGFTVVTGPNNSGKTALMRAIRGVFTNAPAGNNVHWGTAHIIVDIDFGNGNTVTWKKGWEKPGQKGKTVNKYIVNGKELPSVGRGCPPEVLALGMQPIRAGTDTVWPQIADQFKGVLFLVGSPGSTMAEAIANVDRVGKLTAALKLSEKERRKVTSKLNVRREDEKTLLDEVESYDGLDDLDTQVDGLEAKLTEVNGWSISLTTFEALRDRRGQAIEEVASMEGIGKVPVPPQEGFMAAVDLRNEWKAVEALRKRHTTAQGEVEARQGITKVKLPTTKAVQNARKLGKGLATMQALTSRLHGVREIRAGFEGYEDVELPESKKAEKIQAAFDFFTSLQSRRDATRAEIKRLEKAVKVGDTEVATADQEVSVLLVELGVCPTCGAGTAHDHGEES